jgi:hypothetical protein
MKYHFYNRRNQQGIIFEVLFLRRFETFLSGSRSQGGAASITD